jgi:syntaxin 1B/2/3
MEMGDMGNGYGAPQQADPNAILNECREIDRNIDVIDQNLGRLRTLQQRSLEDTDESNNTPTNRQLDELSSETMALYRNFAARIKKIKQNPESGAPRNAPQVGKIDRRLKDTIRQYQTLDAEFRKRLQEHMARRYRIVRPDASDEEVREATENNQGGQIFSQALLQSDRRGQAQSALRAVESRHEAIQKIEQQMIELAQLFQDMEALVVQQEPAVMQIEQKGEEVADNVDKAHIELGGAVDSARAARRKKWWCLLIVVLILIVVAIIVAVVVVVNVSNTFSKEKQELTCRRTTRRRLISDKFRTRNKASHDLLQSKRTRVRRVKRRITEHWGMQPTAKWLFTVI